MWDVNTNTELMQFEEHARRVWSIDFSRVVSSHMLGPWQKKRNSLGIDFKHSGEYDDRPPPPPDALCRIRCGLSAGVMTAPRECGHCTRSAAS